MPGVRTVHNSARYVVPLAGFTQATVVQTPARLLRVPPLSAPVGDLARQTAAIFDALTQSLAPAGGGLDDVVRVRTYVRDLDRWPEIREVWRDRWGATFPASSALEAPDMLGDEAELAMEAIAAVPLDGAPSATLTSISVPVAGTLLFLSGVTARGPDGQVVHPDDVDGQARRVLENVGTILADAGATLSDVRSVHVFVRRGVAWTVVADACARAWPERVPAATVTTVARLFDRRQLVEIDATAFVPLRR